MAPKIIAFIVTLLLNVAAGVAIFFFMLLAMNGFHENDAAWGLGAYIILGILVTLLMSAGAAMLVHVLLKRNFGKAVSALIAVPVFSVVGIGLKIVLSIIGVLVAEYVRVNH